MPSAVGAARNPNNIWDSVISRQVLSATDSVEVSLLPGDDRRKSYEMGTVAVLTGSSTDNAPKVLLIGSGGATNRLVATTTQ